MRRATTIATSCCPSSASVIARISGSALPRCRSRRSTPFSFVAAIGEDGRVIRLWSDRSTNVYQCVRGRLLFDRFPVPPRAPFYLYIHMRFVN